MSPLALVKLGCCGKYVKNICPQQNHHIEKEHSQAQRRGQHVQSSQSRLQSFVQYGNGRQKSVIVYSNKYVRQFVLLSFHPFQPHIIVLLLRRSIVVAFKFVAATLSEASESRSRLSAKTPYISPNPPNHAHVGIEKLEHLQSKIRIRSWSSHQSTSRMSSRCVSFVSQVHCRVPITVLALGPTRRRGCLRMGEDVPGRHVDWVGWLVGW
jgi:hypothetical protein